MGNESVEESKPECSFKFHEFMTDIGDKSIACHIIKMENCLYLWLGDFNENAMNDLSFAIVSPYEKQPLATKIMGPVVNEASSNLAQRLSKKLSKPVYVSFNIEVDYKSLPAIERRLRDEFNAHPEIL
ncbi:proteasome assembly chaperone 4 [Megachile rotundata]|uniref:proteasome assembly chaperone 4 n=1 Tax=Megachile rotundata TaxID=143995 RepID=UPI000258EE2A|nr:PREDICTED: proteasome assembly chaperone 4-like [Megachile rotundata]